MRCGAVLCRAAVLCCAVLCFAVLCCAVLCCAVLCCAVLCCAVLCCAVPCRAVPCNHSPTTPVCDRALFYFLAIKPLFDTTAPTFGGRESASSVAKEMINAVGNTNLLIPMCYAVLLLL